MPCVWKWPHASSTNVKANKYSVPRAQHKTSCLNNVDNQNGDKRGGRIAPKSFLHRQEILHWYLKRQDPYYPLLDLAAVQSSSI